MNLANLVRSKQNFAFSVFRHMARVLALFFAFCGVYSPAIAETRVYLNGLPYTVVQYGQSVTLATYVTEQCRFSTAQCRVERANPYFVNKRNGDSFSSNPRNLLIDYFTRTFIAGVPEEGKVLFQLGGNTVVSSYRGVENGGFVQVVPRTVSAGIYSEKNSLKIGEEFDLNSSAYGYLAKGVLSVEMIDPKGGRSTIYSQTYATETHQMELGLRLALNVPGSYSFVTRFTSHVETNTSAESSYFRVSVAPAATTNSLFLSRPSPVALASPFTMYSIIDGTFGPATGTVEFYDGDVLLGTAPVQSNNVAALTTAMPKGTGGHVLRAKYLGNEFNLPSTTPDFNVTFSPAQPVITLATAQGNSIWGQNVSLEASIAGAAPTGQMSFFDGENLLGTSSIVDGRASMVSSSLEVGTHNITARHAGDLSNLASSSAALALTVAKANVLPTLLSGNTGPLTPDTSLAFIADLSGSAAAVTGTVNFYDGNVLLGSSPLQSNKLALLGSVKLRQLGVHQIRAEYGGDAHFNPATSADLAVTIEMIKTTSTLSSSAATVMGGKPVQFTLSVQGASPTGTASFFANGKLLGKAPLVDGVATLTTKLNRVGRNVITASYSGDTSNLPGNATELIQMVKFNPALLSLIMQIMNN